MKKMENYFRTGVHVCVAKIHSFGPRWRASRWSAESKIFLILDSAWLRKILYSIYPIRMSGMILDYSIKALHYIEIYDWICKDNMKKKKLTEQSEVIAKWWRIMLNSIYVFLHVVTLHSLNSPDHTYNLFLVSLNTHIED